MKTKIKTVHEEKFTQGNKNLTFGVLLNQSIDDDWKESFIYTYKNGTYIFFNTMIEMFEYQLYGELKTERAYMDEETFDSFYDSDSFNGKFGDALKWDKTQFKAF